jgi:hypothetical protein
MTALPGTEYYHKAALLSSVLGEVTISIPDASTLSVKSKSAAKRGNMPFCDAIKVVPAESVPMDDEEEVDLLEYVSKVMFVLRKQPWVNSLPCVESNLLSQWVHGPPTQNSFRFVKAHTILFLFWL